MLCQLKGFNFVLCIAIIVILPRIPNSLIIKIGAGIFSMLNISNRIYRLQSFISTQLDLVCRKTALARGQSKTYVVYPDHNKLIRWRSKTHILATSCCCTNANAGGSHWLMQRRSHFVLHKQTHPQSRSWWVGQLRTTACWQISLQTGTSPPLACGSRSVKSVSSGQHR